MATPSSASPRSTARPAPASVAARVERVARLGAVEATTYLVLVAATIWRLLDGPDIGPIVGLVHGIAFLVYAAAVLTTRDRARWGARTTMALLLASIIPTGGFVAARRLRTGRL
jgi:integral membrane protein